MELFEFTQDKVGCIYKINIKDYFIIGSSIVIEKRLKKHLSRLKNNKHWNPYLQNCFNKHGELNYKTQILQDNIPESILGFVEDVWIGALCGRIEDSKNGLNVRDASRTRHSEITKKKISKSLIGHTNSKESVIKRLETIKKNGGIKYTNEFRERMRKINTGKKLSDATKQKISIARKKLKNGII